MANNNLQAPLPPYYMTKKNRWWVPVIITLVIILGIIIILLTIFFAGIGSIFEKEPYTVKNNSVLYINLMGKLEERAIDSPFQFLNDRSNATFTDIITAIKNAKDDPRIKGIYLKTGLSIMGFAKATELKETIEDFKKSKKFVYAYLNFGTELDYYISLSADKIFMAPEGIIELNGFAISSVFYKELFNKIGIDYYVLGFEDFKSAGEIYSRNNFSDSARYQYKIILDQRLKLLSKEASKKRKISENDFISALSRGIYTPDSLYTLNLIDSLLNEEDVKEIIKRLVFNENRSKSNEDNNNSKSNKNQEFDKDDKLILVDPSKYLDDLPKPKEKSVITDKQIAIIYASGPIVEQIFESPFNNENVITSKQIISALKEAREDEKIKIIILRIDSPGGAVLTSDAIYQEILKTRNIKPVYASMSDVAASGGYYISAPCDTILAHPATITGSIGVIMAIPNLSKLMENIYLNVDTIQTGPAANQFSGFFPLKENDKAKLKTLAGNVYYRFVNKVAQNRKMKFEDVRAIAKGRVWTGEDAYKVGLVDVLGGLEKAIELAKIRMGIPKDSKVYIQTFPKKEDSFQKLLKTFGVIPTDDEEVKSSNYSGLSKIFANELKTLFPIYYSLPKDVQEQLSYMLTILAISDREKVIFALPELINIK